MMNRMPCEKKKQKPLIELWRSNKKRIDDALSVVGSKLINIAVITLFVLFYLGSVIYVFWPSSPSSHSSEQSENNTSSSSESLVQNSKHNHVKIYSNRLDSEPVNACDSMVDAAPKPLSLMRILLRVVRMAFFLQNVTERTLRYTT